MVLSKINIEVG